MGNEGDKKKVKTREIENAHSAAVNVRESVLCYNAPDVKVGARHCSGDAGIQRIILRSAEKEREVKEREENGLL